MTHVAASGMVYPDQLYNISADDYHRRITATIERIVNLKRYTFVGGMYDEDDLAQELRARLVKATGSLGHGKSVFIFLVKCADNLILDLWRGVYRANNPPCKRCASGQPCRVDGGKCTRAREYEAILKTRRNIDRPEPLNEVDIVHFDTAWENVLAQELNERIITALPAYLLKSYHNLTNAGGKDVPASHRRKIREIVGGLIHGQKD
jgi:DNA-directed RNA polymerase specialized sigma24 family protein